MLKAAKISFLKAKTDIVVFGIINCLVYILALMAFKYLNLLHIWGLRMVDYIFLGFVSIYQVHRWIRQRHGYVPFLEAFFTSLFTGAFSFILFAAFIFLYSFDDPYLNKLYISNTNNANKLVPAIIIMFEGGGASLIVALITSFYAARFEDGELSE